MKFVSSRVNKSQQIPFVCSLQQRHSFLLPPSQLFSLQSFFLLVVAVSMVLGEALPDAGYAKGRSRGYYDDGPIVIHLVQQVPVHPIHINHNPVHFNPPPIYHGPINYSPGYYGNSYHWMAAWPRPAWKVERDAKDGQGRSAGLFCVPAELVRERINKNLA